MTALGGKCVATGCENTARGFFCDTCWGRLPWDRKAAISSRRKTGTQIKDKVKYAKDWLDTHPAAKEGEHAADQHRN